MTERLTELFEGYMVDGADMSLFTGLDWQHYTLYCKIRETFSRKYPKSEELREDEEDTVDYVQAHCDPDATLWQATLFETHGAFERTRMLQHLATDYEKKVVRLYCHLTRNWHDFSSQYMKILHDSDLYEIVESYFKILRKYGLTTHEEPYYFLSPNQRHKIKVAGEMLKRNTMIDDSEIKVSILEELP